MRQMMHAVFISQLTHECSVWYTPKPGKISEVVGINKSLTSVQYRAERAIIGAYKAISRVTLNIETHSMSMNLRLDKLACDTALRIAISPFYLSIIETRSKDKKRTLSSLELLIIRLERRTKILVKNLKQITSYSTPSWWRSPTINIALNKDTAAKEHKASVERNIMNDFFIYSDGSGINGKIGATAVSPDCTARAYLGPTTLFTVYSVELCGIILTATIAVFGENSQTTRGRLIICVDNQAAIKAVKCSGNSSGQHLIKIIVILINTLRARGVKVEIH